MTQAVDENRPRMVLWLALRAIRTARRSNRLADIAYGGMVRTLKEMGQVTGENYFRRSTSASRHREVIMWSAAEMHRMAKDEMPSNGAASRRARRRNTGE